MAFVMSCGGDGRGGAHYRLAAPVLSRRRHCPARSDPRTLRAGAVAGRTVRLAARRMRLAAAGCQPPRRPARRTARQRPARSNRSRSRAAAPRSRREGDADAHGRRRRSARASARSARRSATLRRRGTQRFEVEGDVEYRRAGAARQGRLVDPGDGTAAAASPAPSSNCPQRPARGAAARARAAPDGDIAAARGPLHDLPDRQRGLVPARGRHRHRPEDAAAARAATCASTSRACRSSTRRGFRFRSASARKSGFLFPSFGSSEQERHELGVPYYLNLAPNYDLTLTPRLLTRRGLRARPGVPLPDAGAAAARSSTRLPAQRPGWRTATAGLGTLWHRTRLRDRAAPRRCDAADASDGHYFEDFGARPGRHQRHLPRSPCCGLAWLGEHWRLDGRVQDFQMIERSRSADEDRPYSRLPQLSFTGTLATGRRRCRHRLDAELTWFERDVGVTGLRLDARAARRLALRGPRLLRRAERRLALHGLVPARRPRQAPTTRRIARRRVLSLDAGLVFERESGSQTRLRADARAAAALPLDPVPRPGRPAGVRHRRCPT